MSCRCLVVVLLWRENTVVPAAVTIAATVACAIVAVAAVVVVAAVGVVAADVPFTLAAV